MSFRRIIVLLTFFGMVVTAIAGPVAKWSGEALCALFICTGPIWGAWMLYGFSG